MDTTSDFACGDNCLTSWFTLVRASLTSTAGRRCFNSVLTYADPSLETRSAVDSGKLAIEMSTSGTDGTSVSPSTASGGDATASWYSGCRSHADDDDVEVCHNIRNNVTACVL